MKWVVMHSVGSMATLVVFLLLLSGVFMAPTFEEIKAENDKTGAFMDISIDYY